MSTVPWDEKALGFFDEREGGLGGLVVRRTYVFGIGRSFRPASTVDVSSVVS